MVIFKIPAAGQKEDGVTRSKREPNLAATSYCIPLQSTLPSPKFSTTRLDTLAVAMGLHQGENINKDFAGTREEVVEKVHFFLILRLD